MGAGPNSEALFERARRVIPGGVNSPVRAFRAVGGTPLFVRRGAGARIEDEDGRVYLDFVGSWGPLVLGHAHPEVLEAVTAAAARGSTFGAPCAAEVELAEAVVAAYPGLEMVRFVSSGTEAVMSAIRLARGATGRDLVVKFSGCYHGHADHLLVAAGSGLVTFGRPSSAGVPEPFAELTRVLPLDDEAAVVELFAREGARVAAVILEPIPANNGLLVQRREFLETLRRLTREAGALLVFDEVISGFRVARGGAAERLGITPDLATFGKIVGGGMPVGAFGGRAELMTQLAPLGPVYQAGTLSGNPVAMAAASPPCACSSASASGSASSRSAPSSSACWRPCSRLRRCRRSWCASGRCSGSPSRAERRRARPKRSTRRRRGATGRSSTVCSTPASRSRPRPTRSGSCPPPTPRTTSLAWRQRCPRRSSGRPAR